jgi:hypothetical protein
MSPVRFVGGGASGSRDIDVLVSLGDEGEREKQSAVMAPVSLGAEGSTWDNISQATLIVPTGGGVDSDVWRETGVTARSLGSEGSTERLTSLNLAGFTMGASGATFTANSAITAHEQGTGTRVDLAPTGGDATWSTPANAQVEDGTESVITLTGSATAARAYSDELRLDSFTPGATPTGWTRTGYDLLVRHRWTTVRAATDLTSTCSHTIVVRYTDGTEVTLSARTEASPNQAALTTETFGLDAAKTVERVMLRAVCSIALAAATTTFAWQVDAARLRFTYSRTGIS